ncbi:Fur family transcriptional regulator [Clostridium oryzae]|uniref:Peroxide operon regulator n=1 Tax=Clostridium oryzae TaxID=1450648 RepID=A0A1V4IHK1_9CLOT|nr:transcriptional repressor [Clostridium oryzae]OPJ58997.1 peroxide operon regulator [Clostridium oryzae]
MSYNELLKSKNMKVTFARRIILEILSNAKEALNVEYIYQKCNGYGHNINLSTVYRNLEAFVKDDIVKKFDLGDGKYSYAIIKDKHKHTIECSICHKEMEIDCPFQMFGEMIKNKTGFTMTEHEFRVKGICKQCKDKKI